MQIDRVDVDSGDLEVETTGARFSFDRTGALAITARLGERRPIASFSLGTSTDEPWWVNAAGAAELTADRAGIALRIGGDSVVRLRATRPSEVRLDGVAFRPTYEASVGAHRFAADEDGAIGVYARGRARAHTGRQGRVTWHLDTDAELWLHPTPCRLRHPVRERQSIAHEGRPRAPHPTAAVIEDAARTCDILALHAYFWQDAPRSLRPRFPRRYSLRPNPWRTARHEPSDPARFAEVRDLARNRGLALVLYVSPWFSSAPDFDAELDRILERHRPDGLYLDGTSPDFGRAYDLVRRCRRALGPNRILYLHASDQPFRSPRLPCTPVETHADFVLKGGRGRGGLPLDTFLRYGVSGRNLSQAVGVWCHYGSWGGPFPRDRAPSPTHVEAALAAGVRLWRRSHWKAAGLKTFDAVYPRALGALLAGSYP